MFAILLYPIDHSKEGVIATSIVKIRHCERAEKEKAPALLFWCCITVALIAPFSFYPPALALILVVRLTCK